MPTTTALVRLIATALLLALGWLLACRPSWSPDGRHLVYSGRKGDAVCLLRYDRETGAITQLATAAEGRAAFSTCWTRNGDELVILQSLPEPGNAKPGLKRRQGGQNGPGKHLQITCLSPTGEQRRQFSIECADQVLYYLISPPVVLDDELFLGGHRLQKVDLKSGAVTTVDLGEPDAKRPGECVLCAYGDGIAYMYKRNGASQSDWEFGTLDPKTLARTPRFVSPPGSRWQVLPLPAISKDQSRIALAAHRPADGKPAKSKHVEVALLVFRDGKLESELKIDDGDVAAGAPVFGPDGVTVYCTVVKRGQEGTDFAMYETTISGSVTRRTHILRNQDHGTGSLAMAATSLPVSVSPDGALAAITTAYIPELADDRQGLLLVDLKDKQRKVTRVPFPE